MPEEKPLFPEPIPVMPDAIRNELGSFPFKKKKEKSQGGTPVPWKKKGR